MNFKNFKGITAEQAITISMIIDKMEIKNDLASMEINTGNEKSDKEELGKQLIALIISKLYKAKDEIFEFIANYKGISIEEAKKVEIIGFLKELFGMNEVVDFLV